MRDELFNESLFFELDHARSAIAESADDYNHFRQHSSLGYQTPADYVGSNAATGSNAAQDQSFAFSLIVHIAPLGVLKMAGARVALGEISWQVSSVMIVPWHLENLSVRISFIRDIPDGDLKHFVDLRSAHEISYQVGPICKPPHRPLPDPTKQHLPSVQQFYCEDFSAANQWLAVMA